MGILDAIRSQFIEVIEWLDDSGNTLLYRFPVQGQEIKNGARLTVRESQTAVFVFQGQIAENSFDDAKEMSSIQMISGA
jgi:membrane protease subunit (stomatin/prohibitin family)